MVWAAKDELYKCAKCKQIYLDWTQVCSLQGDPEVFQKGRWSSQVISQALACWPPTQEQPRHQGMLPAMAPRDLTTMLCSTVQNRQEHQSQAARLPKQHICKLSKGEWASHCRDKWPPTLCREPWLSVQLQPLVSRVSSRCVGIWLVSAYLFLQITKGRKLSISLATNVCCWVSILRAAAKKSSPLKVTAAATTAKLVSPGNPKMHKEPGDPAGCWVTVKTPADGLGLVFVKQQHLTESSKQ